MAETNSSFPRFPDCPDDFPAEVLIELHRGTGRPIVREVPEDGFLVGSVPGCDLRLPGIDLPPVICLVSRRPRGAGIRRLAPAQSILVNGQPLAGNVLQDNDCLTIDTVELRVRVNPIVGEVLPDWEEQASKALCASAADPSADRSIQELTDDKSELEEQVRQFESRQQEVEATRKELAELRGQLYERYRERRDRLAGLQEAVNVAARKVQEQKRQVESEAKQEAERRKEHEARRAEMDARIQELEREKQACADHDSMLASRREECQAQERKVAEDRQTLEKNQAQHQADLLRLDRSRADLELREKQLQDRMLELARQTQELEHGQRDSEETEKHLHEWQARLSSDAESLAQEEARLSSEAAQVSQRTGATESQQATLAALRNRLEQMREALHRDEQQLAVQRARQDESETVLKRQMQEVQRATAQADQEKQKIESDRQTINERTVAVNDAVNRFRQTQESLAAEDQRLRQRAEALEETAARQTEEASRLQIRSVQLLEMQERLAGEKQSLREREADLAHAEQARAALQEQLRRRSEELNERQKAVAEQARQRAEQIAAVETRRVEIEREREQAEERLTALTNQIAVKSSELERLQGELNQREEIVRGHVERLKEAGRTISTVRKSMSEEKTRWENERQEAADALAAARAELTQMRQATEEQQKQMPELELRARTAADRLAAAREQLCDHLEELHAYARQRHEELAALRTQVQGEAEQVHRHYLVLQRARDEHRLAVAGFRQQIIAWQGQVAELKRTLASDETRLDRRQALVDEAARAVDETSARLALQAEHLHEQEREVADQREQMGHQLSDMREWYRHKLRELAGITSDMEARRITETSSANAEAEGEPSSGSTERTILALTGEVDPGDRKLGDLLRSLELVESGTLTALLIEARRQRRSLRQVLLASGLVTLYQLALIETGNIDGLMLGPVRVVDRLRVTPRETVFRVFDPRRCLDEFTSAGKTSASGEEPKFLPMGCYALLRCLAESEMQDAVHPDEFRQRFSAAASVSHPHLAATYEVLEIAGRPAVLQELVTGLPSTEWSDLAAVPGICYRLLSQAALGLHTAHQAGLVHGRLQPDRLVLTVEGTLKLIGFGEPPWLSQDAQTISAHEATTGESAPVACEPHDDLLALGRMAEAWMKPASRGKGSKIKSAAKPLLEVIKKLGSTDPENRYASAEALLQDLDRVGADVPPNAEAWERLLRYVREQEVEETSVRQSA